MLYEVEVSNKKGEGIFRAKNWFEAEKEKTVFTDEMGFKELKACQSLILKVFYSCPHCRKRFDKKRGLYTHINMAHPEHAHTILKE